MSNKKILIVEDDVDVRNGMRIRLQANHYDTFFAVDAVSAMTAVRQNRPDLILLDLGLPAGGGFAVMGWLNAIPDLALIPIIIVSGRTGQETRAQAMNAGAKAFLEKPVDTHELLAVIRQALGEHVSYSES